LRFPMIYGPRQLAPREWSIIRRILDGRKHLIVPDRGLKLERRGYAENVAHAVLLSVDKVQESTGKIYNVGDEVIWSLRQWVGIIARTLNHEWELISMPFSLARPSRPYVGRSFHWITDIEKIKTELGYRDKIPAREGLEQTVKWYLKNRPEYGGELEQQLKDPFDYEAEDQLISEYEEAERRIRERTFVGYRYRHADDHPQKGG
jgi:nucleoside-diphosphate-sugar epimerase